MLLPIFAVYDAAWVVRSSSPLTDASPCPIPNISFSAYGSGIWISTSAIVQPGSSGCTFLLDCEGTGDPLEGSETSNARIALTCILLSSVFLYNNTGRPDRSSLQFLGYLNTVRRRLPLHATNPPPGGQQSSPSPSPLSLTLTQSSNRRNFPAFLWVFRDFFLQLPKRRDTGKQYTLGEYMTERILVPSNRGRQDEQEDAVVDALRNDFRSFDVLSIGYPKKKHHHGGGNIGDVPFDADELSTLDSVPWADFDDEFRTQVEHTIAVALAKTAPFRLGGDGDTSNGKDDDADLGPVAHGPLYAAWCHRVVELVNSEDVIPDLPDLQQRLMQSIADDKVAAAIRSYSDRMNRWLDECPVYDDDVDGGRDGMVIAADMVADDRIRGEGVAEDRELERHSLGVLVGLCQDLRKDIPSERLLDESMDRVKRRCVKGEDGGGEGGGSMSILAQLRETNARRSRENCEAIARRLYMTFRSIVRESDTKMSLRQFEAGAGAVEAKYRAIARGPAVASIADTFLREQRDADRVFLERVGSINVLYRDTLQKKVALDKDVEQKSLMVTELKCSIDQINQQHQEQVEKINKVTQDKMKKMTENHSNELNIAIEKQKKEEEKNIASLQDDMNARLQKVEEDRAAELKRKQEEMEAAEREAEKHLAVEVAAREERLRKEEAAHEEEIKRLLSTADVNMKREIMAAEEKRQADKVQFQAELDRKLTDAERKRAEEVQAREARLRAEEKRHRDELERVRKELNEKMELQKKKYLQEIEDLEKECFNSKACSIQ